MDTHPDTITCYHASQLASALLTNHLSLTVDEPLNHDRFANVLGVCLERMTALAEVLAYRYPKDSVVDLLAVTIQDTDAAHTIWQEACVGSPAAEEVSS